MITRRSENTPRWRTRSCLTRRRCRGSGDADFGRFAGLLYEDGYRGPVCVEVEDRAFEGSETDVEAALKISAGVLRPYFPKG